MENLLLNIFLFDIDLSSVIEIVGGIFFGILGFFWKKIYSVYQEKKKIDKKLWEIFGTYYKNLIQLYIPVFFQRKPPTSQDLNDEKLYSFLLNEILRKPKIFYYIFAETGMGKTAFLVNFYKKYKSRWCRKPAKLEIYVLNDFNINDFDRNFTGNKKETVLLLDALDEHKCNNKEEFNKFFSQLIECVATFKGAIITCRSQYLNSEFIKKYSEHCLYLSYFSEEQVNTFLSKKFPFWKMGNSKKRKIAKEIIFSKQDKHKILNVANRPLILQWIDEIIDEKDNLKYNFSFFKIIIAKWLKRENDKSQNSPENQQKIDVAKLNNAALELFLHKNISTQELNKIDETRSLFKQNADGNFTFLHNSFYYYLLAKLIFEQIIDYNDFDFNTFAEVKKFFNEMRHETLKSQFENCSFYKNEKINPTNYDKAKTITIKNCKQKDVLPFLQIFTTANKFICNHVDAEFLLNIKLIHKIKSLVLQKCVIEMELQYFANFENLTHLCINNIDIKGKSKIGEFLNKGTLNIGKTQHGDKENFDIDLFFKTLSKIKNFSLRKLDLRFLIFDHLPKEITNYTELESLIIDGIWTQEEFNADIDKDFSIPLKKLPADFSKLTNLTELWLANTQISELPADFSKLTNLTKLHLGNTQISELPADFSKLTNLTGLYLWNTQISELPADFSKLTNLTRLSLHNTQISELPADFSKLTNLTVLDLRNTQISELPADFSKLTNLTELSLANTQISELPADFSKLTNLTELWLSNTQISELPADFSKLTNLTELYLHNTQISELPADFSKLTNLTTLWLSNTQISELPADFSKLTNLTILDLRNTQISELPADFSKLTNLTELDLRNTQISTLPADFSKLTNLTVLSLANTQISELPADFSKLTNLTILWLANTQISELPADFSKLTNLTILILANTPLANNKQERLKVLKMFTSQTQISFQGISEKDGSYAFHDKLYGSRI